MHHCFWWTRTSGSEKIVAQASGSIKCWVWGLSKDFGWSEREVFFCKNPWKSVGKFSSMIPSIFCINSFFWECGNFGLSRTATAPSIHKASMLFSTNSWFSEHRMMRSCELILNDLLRVWVSEKNSKNDQERSSLIKRLSLIHIWRCRRRLRCRSRWSPYH